jgi:hypothetical protein
MSQTALYRHFNANNVLLYVGISLCATTRLAQHRDAAHWFDQITRVTVEWHPTREAAERAEAIAIVRETPKFNIDRPRVDDSELAGASIVRAIALEDLRTIEELANDRPALLTTQTLRYQLRNRNSNGLAPACVRIGKRLLISRSRYEAWLGTRAGEPL